MILEHQLAQQIVDRTMEIIGYNINVMNHAGIIIGSGKAHRLGQVHDGAVLALQHGDSVEISQESCGSLKGVKPGINMLLKSDQGVVGVVGITGEPDVIRDFASLVKMTAEMIIEQAALIEQLQWDRRHREEFILAWIDNRLSLDELKKWGARLNIDVTQPRVAVVVELNQQDTPQSTNTIRQVVELLEKPARDNLVAVNSMNEIVVLKPCGANDSWSSELESKRLDKLLMRLEQNHVKDFKIALGQFFANPMDMQLSYQSAKQVLLVGKRHYPDKRKYVFDKLRLSVLLSPLNQFWQGEQLCDAVITLRQKDKSGQLMKTIEMLFSCDGSASECAKALYIHRNTLRYRLNKITEITGIDTTNFTGLVELYIACQISKLS